MEFPIYIREWHGIDLTRLPSAAAVKDSPAGPEVYGEFYAALNAGKGAIAPSWITGKQRLGEAIETLFAEFRTKHGREPSVLAIGAGRAYAEGVWLDHGREVTLNEWQEDSLEFATSRWPGVKTLVGDARTLNPEARYDFITLLTMDYTMRADEFSGVLEACGRHLTADGAVVMYCASILSFRQMAAETVKQLRGTYRKTPHLFWGYWRTPGVLVNAAESAGLGVAGSYRVAGSVLVRRAAWKDRLPPRRDPGLIQVLKAKRQKAETLKR